VLPAGAARPRTAPHGNDLLDGGGSLTFDPRAVDGSHTLFGGIGRDTVTEATHRRMNLSVDAEPNVVVVGHPDQGTDDIRTDEENVIGGPFDDTILGSPANNRLVGGGGSDDLRGGDGNDTLVPGAGDDTLNGGPGTDTCKQGPGSGPATGCEH